MVHPHSPLAGAAGVVDDVAGVGPVSPDEPAPGDPCGSQPVMARTTRMDARVMKFIDPGFPD